MLPLVRCQGSLDVVQIIPLDFQKLILLLLLILDNILHKPVQIVMTSRRLLVQEVERRGKGALVREVVVDSNEMRMLVDECLCK
jgi:hypothetical protein